MLHSENSAEISPERSQTSMLIPLVFRCGQTAGIAHKPAFARFVHFMFIRTAGQISELPRACCSCARFGEGIFVRSCVIFSPSSGDHEACSRQAAFTCDATCTRRKTIRPIARSLANRTNPHVHKCFAPVEKACLPACTNQQRTIFKHPPRKSSITRHDVYATP